MSSKVKMRGFMCQSPGSMMCMPDDMRSVIVPGKSNRRSMFVNQHSNVKYSMLIDSEDLLSKPENQTQILLSLNAKNVKGDHHHSRVLHHQKKTGESESEPTSSAHVFQVVVLRVSLHCQGCAGKVKKHLSRMQGVTSFSIDLETKRVTVMGHVSPSNVLESISKIKRAEFWTC